MNRSVLPGLLVVAGLASCTSTGGNGATSAPSSGTAAITTDPVAITGAATTVSITTPPSTTPPSTTPPSTASSAPPSLAAEQLAGIAARTREICRSEGAVVAISIPGAAPALAVSGQFAPGVALHPESQFFAGSVTKLLVATLALQLVDEGRLALDDPVSRYLPWPRGEEITIAMLLSHRSGMGDYGNDFGPQLRELVLADLDRVFTYDEVLAMVAAVPAVAEPGTTYHYTNANSIVLGAIVQSLRGESLGQSMRGRVLDPLGLEHTFYGPDDLPALAAVEFHGLFDVMGTGAPIDIGSFGRAAAFTVDPAGAGLVTNAGDALALLDGLFAGDVLSAGSRAVLADLVSTLDADALLLDANRQVVGHGGASPGAQVIAAHDQVSGTSAVAWCNRLDPGPDELLATVLGVSELLTASNP